MLTDDNKKTRLNKIPASLAAAVLGLDAYCTPLQAYEKIKGIVVDDDADMSVYAEWGHRLEPVVAQKFAEKNGVTVQKNTQTIVHKNGWLCGTPDYYYVTTCCHTRGLEIKTTSAWNASEYGEEHTDELPLRHYVQCVVYMLLHDVDVWDVAVLIGGNNYREYRVTATREQRQRIYAQLECFYAAYIATDTPPPAEAADAQRLWGNATTTGQQYIADDNVSAMIAQMSEQKKLIDMHTTQYDALKAVLLLKMQDAESIVDSAGQRLASYKSQIRKTLDTARLKAEKQDVYNAYIKESSSRVFKLLQQQGEVK